MSTPQTHFYALLGASVLGMVCAAALYVSERIQHQKRQHKLSKDLKRMDNELSQLRQELDQILKQQKDKSESKRRSKKSSKAESLLSSSTTTLEDFSSTADADSSDLEFYDVSDDEEVDASSTAVYEAIDRALDSDVKLEIEDAVEKLSDLYFEDTENPEILWRIGKAHHKLFQKTEDKTKQREHIDKGVEACERALVLSPLLAPAHKWLAILYGSRSDFQPIKDRIIDGNLFKKHVDQALSLLPNDSFLHYLSGRYAYEVASLKWYERTVATTLFAEPPTCTYEEALNHFLEAENLAAITSSNGIENKLFIGKCKIKLGDIEEAIVWLERAEQLGGTDNGVDNKDYVELKELLDKYKPTR